MIHSISIRTLLALIIAGSLFIDTFLTPALATPQTPPQTRRAYDFDGDGKSDNTIWRPSDQLWYINTSSSAPDITRPWGIPNDTLVPADYDGDGKTDLAVYRLEPQIGGVWYISNSSNGTTFVLTWGQTGDLPVPADYDGDTKADIAVWRPSEGSWLIRNSSNNGTQNTAIFWGISTDVPVPADYDGDGKTDAAVWRASDLTWYINTSSSAPDQIRNWGIAGDVLTPADYDGDGLADVAVWRVENSGIAIFYVSTTSPAGDFVQQWGQAGDIPVPGDYDGDGKNDFVVFRPSNGAWVINNSHDNTMTVRFWGISSDKVPARYTPGFTGPTGPFNSPPTVNISSPTPGQTFPGPTANIPISVNATDSDGTISKVEFFGDSSQTPFAIDTVAPFSTTWSGVGTGTHIITAKATDNGGAATPSQIAITVGSSPEQTPFNGPHNVPGITQIEDFDNGGEGIAYHDNDPGNSFGSVVYRNTDVDIVGGGSGLVVGNARAEANPAQREWLEYTVNVLTSGNYELYASVASDGAGGRFHYEIDRDTATPIFTGQVEVPNTNNWNGFLDAPTSDKRKVVVALSAGTHIVRLALDQNGTQQFPAVANFDYLNIVPAGTTQPPDSPPSPDLSDNQIGRLTSVGNGVSGTGGVRIFYGYDDLGRSSGTIHKLDNTSYINLTGYGYPQNNSSTAGLGTAVLTETFPDNEQVAYTYDLSGVAQSIKTTPSGGQQKTIISSVKRNPRGQTLEVVYGNGATSTHAYNDDTNLFLKQITTSVSGNSLQDYAYGFDNNGNVTAITDNKDHSLDATYNYDSLDQLSSMQPQGPVLPYEYDALGNLKKKESSVQTYGGTQSCSGCAPVRGPHALATSQGVTYNYDRNGDLISTTGSSSTSITWNAEHMPTHIVKGGVVIDKFYLGETLWKKVEPGLVTLYLPSARVENGRIRKFFGGFAERSPNDGVAGSENDGKLKFYHNDHLGSASLVTNEVGTVLRKQSYLPYGEDRLVSPNNFTPRYQFNFKEKEASGLYDYGARLYNPATGRWISADSSLADGLNRFAYVSNNPLRYSDPTGHEQSQIPAPKDGDVMTNENGETLMWTESLGQWVPVDDGSSDVRLVVNWDHNVPGVPRANTIGPATSPEMLKKPVELHDRDTFAVNQMLNITALSANYGEFSNLPGGMWRGMSSPGPRNSSNLLKARGFKVLGRATFFTATAFSVYQGVDALRHGNTDEAAKAAVDIGIGYVTAFGGPPGLVIGGIYYTVDMTIGWKRTDGLTYTVPRCTVCQGNKPDYGKFFRDRPGVK